ncbi:uncharacterized protein MELLADRAFT_55975 [Melampsora larici-populina 98AG31]|uniref:Uncharacterized protein n=1 Tax=Melampsora larici-populina (strain 98AG31 / pathotype 3-4-7) TaxID=747676 RepID=F4RKF9_MELLP|nr:uncharacterized protein MELLADRAFT_55975 [Melampsora larici-populina 98AG31]EGG07188.1 hypothetical protein MELLADRAFT_55975 [Melampsora larici-populina 98AG31]
MLQGTKKVKNTNLNNFKITKINKSHFKASRKITLTNFNYLKKPINNMLHTFKTNNSKTLIFLKTTNPFFLFF